MPSATLRTRCRFLLRFRQLSRCPGLLHESARFSIVLKTCFDSFSTFCLRKSALDQLSTLYVFEWTSFMSLTMVEIV